MKKHCKFRVGKQRPKNRSKIDSGRVLASIWEGFGTGWGLSWALLGASWAFFGPSKSSFVKGFVPDGFQEAFWIDFGSIWGDFGRVLEGFRPNFEWVWEKIEEESGRILKNWPCWGRFSNWTPALVRSASQYDVNTWGFPNPPA